MKILSDHIKGYLSPERISRMAMSEKIPQYNSFITLFYDMGFQLCGKTKFFTKNIDRSKLENL